MLVLAKRGTTNLEKPTEVVREQGSRLPWVWDALRFAAPLHEAERDSARDLVVNAAPSAVAGLVWTADPSGNVAASLGPASYIAWPDNPAHNRPTESITAYVRLRNAGTGEVNSGLFCKRYDTNPEHPKVTWGILGNFMGAPNLAAHLVLAGVPYFCATPTAPDTAVWVSAVLRWSSGLPLRLDVYGERGDLLSSADSGSAVIGTLAYGVAGLPIVLNATADDTVNYSGDYSQALLWSRYLADTEIQALVADPFGWYSPRSETVVAGWPFPPTPGSRLPEWSFGQFVAVG